MQIFSQFSHPMQQDSADLVSGKQNIIKNPKMKNS